MVLLVSAYLYLHMSTDDWILSITRTSFFYFCFIPFLCVCVCVFGSMLFIRWLVWLDPIESLCPFFFQTRRNDFSSPTWFGICHKRGIFYGIFWSGPAPARMGCARAKSILQIDSTQTRRHASSFIIAETEDFLKDVRTKVGVHAVGFLFNFRIVQIPFRFALCVRLITADVKWRMEAMEHTREQEWKKMGGFFAIYPIQFFRFPLPHNWGQSDFSLSSCLLLSHSPLLCCSVASANQIFADCRFSLQFRFKSSNVAGWNESLKHSK